MVFFYKSAKHSRISKGTDMSDRAVWVEEHPGKSRELKQKPTSFQRRTEIS